jgi:hypothetical protein
VTQAEEKLAKKDEVLGEAMVAFFREWARRTLVDGRSAAAPDRLLFFSGTCILELPRFPLQSI